MKRKYRFGMVMNEREKTALDKLTVLEEGLSKAVIVRSLILQAARSKRLMGEFEGSHFQPNSSS